MTVARGICFDFNGVIVDDERHHCRALIDTLAEDGITLDPDRYYRDYLGFDDRGCFRHAWHGTGRELSEAELERLIEAKGERYRALISADLTLVPGAATFIGQVAMAGISAVVVSAARRWEIEHVLQVSGLASAFRGIVSADEVQRTKPDPEGYLKGLTLLGIPAASCVVIEDSIPGMLAGRAAGMRVAMLTTSHPVDELRHAEPESLWEHFVGRHPEELPWHTT